MVLATRAIAAVVANGKSANKKQTQGNSLSREVDRRARTAAKLTERRLSTGLAIVPQNLEPEVPQINVAQLADAMHLVFTTWARGLTPEETDLLTLWTLSTWAADSDDRLLFDAMSRLFMIAEKGSGKSRLERLIAAMSRNSTGIVTMATAPGVRDALTEGMTVILDEFDRMLGKTGARHMDLQALVASYQKGTASLNGVGKLNQQEAFGPMVLAAKPRILINAGEWVEDLAERSFMITPRKHTDQNDPIPDLDGQFSELCEEIKKLAQQAGKFWWVQEQGETLTPIHSIPKALTGRQREISSHILAMGDRAVNPLIVAEQGSDIRWAIRARNAVQAVLFGYSTSDGERQIQIIRDRFAEMGIDLDSE
jgi:hypothetical protein